MAHKQTTRDDNVCEYFLFPPENLTKGRDLREHLEETRVTYLAELSSLLTKYVWQKEPFRLVVAESETGSASSDDSSCIRGRTDYGDNVEDEWFIVYLLFKLTKTFPGLVAKINDVDGEFLLIEAADDLPKWLNPDTAENRVFVYNGSIRIIPQQPNTPAELTSLPSGVPSVRDAVSCVRNESMNGTMASEEIQDKIQKRISDYPEKIQESLHRAHCYVPAALAYVLKQAPHLLAPGVEAFYHRDPVDLKACTIMSHFRPGTRVMTEVMFTKCLYAQLMQQKFRPHGDWGIPSQPSAKSKAYDLGMKLAHGFEILCAQCKSLGGSDAGENQLDKSRWSKYLQSLKDRGYFRGELEGSKLYMELLDEAKLFYENSVQPKCDDQQHSGLEVLKILKSGKIDIEEIRKQEKFLKPADDDGWLDVTPEMFDSMLAKASGRMNQMDLNAIAKNVGDFVNQESGFEGAEVPGDNDEIQFESGGFIQSMEKIFEFDDPQSDSDSDMSEYGEDASDDDYGLGAPTSKPTHKKSSKPVKPNGVGKKKEPEVVVEKIADYMKLMDKELAGTQVRKSLEDETTETKPTPPPRTKKMQKKLREQELLKVNAAAQNRTSSASDFSDIDALDDDFVPVNVNMADVQNLLESYTAQHGLAGPTSNLLGSMKDSKGK